MKISALILLLCLPFILCTDKPTETTDEQPTTNYFLPQDTPDDVFHNLFTAIGFTDTTITQNEALEAYKNCLVLNDTSVHYSFIHPSYMGTPESLYATTDTTLMKLNFSNAADSIFDIDMLDYRVLNDSVSVENDSIQNYSFNVYSYEIRTRIAYNLFSSSSFPYLINGEIVLYIKQCDDGLYRIFKWYDISDIPALEKAATMGYSSWWHFKTFFKD